MRALVALSNARDILRPPETFSGDDLNVACRRAAKRVAPGIGRDGMAVTGRQSGAGCVEGSWVLSGGEVGMEEPEFLWWPGMGDPERQIIMERHLRHQATPLKDRGAVRPVRGERGRWR